MNRVIREKMETLTQSILLSDCSGRFRSVRNGVAFRMAINGNRANSIETNTPITIPLKIDFHEMANVTFTGKKPANTSGNTRCINVPSNAPINEPIKPITAI